MPAPLIWFGVSAIIMFAGVKYPNVKRLDKSFGCLPGETDKKIEAVNDAILTCGAFLSF